MAFLADPDAIKSLFTRRIALQAGLAGGAATLLGALGTAAPAQARDKAGGQVEPAAGSWKTWVLSSGSQLRPGPPPVCDSAQRAAELAEAKSYARDAHRGTELAFWADDPAGRPAPDSGPFSSNQAAFYYAPLVHLIWFQELSQKLSEYRLDANPPRAARAYALVSVAGYEAGVAGWDAKFTYRTGRPIHFDPTITTVLPTYPIPDYPSGHATMLGGHRPRWRTCSRATRTSSRRGRPRTPRRVCGPGSTSAAPATSDCSSAATSASSWSNGRRETAPAEPGGGAYDAPKNPGAR
jgi:hypothetical protein